jgi:hypothetical protein
MRRLVSAGWDTLLTISTLQVQEKESGREKLSTVQGNEIKIFNQQQAGDGFGLVCRCHILFLSAPHKTTPSGAAGIAEPQMPRNGPVNSL